MDLMVIIPFAVNETEYCLFIALQDGNIERVRQYDPVMVKVEHFADYSGSRRLRAIYVGYADDADIAAISEMKFNDDTMPGVLSYLSRGFQVLPGDHDGPPLSIEKPKGKPS